MTAPRPRAIAPSTERYPAIEDHGAIGDLHTVALVSRDGAIDWCCLPNLDSPSVFASLLDHDRGGRFRIAARGCGLGEQRYLTDTNVLETVFATGNGTLVVTDHLPVSGTLDGSGGGSRCDHAIHRLLRVEGGPVEVEVEWSPRPDHAREAPQIVCAGDGHLAWCGDVAVGLWGLGDDAEVDADPFGPVVRSRLVLEDGDRRLLVCRWGAEPADTSLDAGDRALAGSIEAWRGWVHADGTTGTRGWAGEHAAQVVRSELVLKLLSHAGTGAIAAAATTSLPEEIGGVRNWDYRYSWIRDSALAAQALFALGHEADATAFIQWAERAASRHEGRDRGLQIVYALDGSGEIGEQELVNFEGYRRSAPVRVGNGAAGQLQLDIYGELISAAYEVDRLDGELEPEVRAFLPRVADEACHAWQDPDYGIWEPRNGPFHHVYSKVMVWMALDRAVRLAEGGVIDGDVEGWCRNIDLVRDEILERGFDPALGAFRQSYERGIVDASNLLIPLTEFLPFDDPRVQANLDRTLDELMTDGLVHRYHGDDGVAGGEGAFGLCTFWAVDALALSGRVDEASELYRSMLARANHLGLFSEQIDPASGAFLGNFPQAFTHLGVINSALYLAHVEGRGSPVSAPIGSDEHRAERTRPR